MVRTWDARTLLFNTFFDGKRMLDGDMKPRDVVKYVEKKIEFMKNPPPGNKVNW
jgi:hypothetical protein